MRKFFVLFFLSLATVSFFAPAQAAKPRIRKTAANTSAGISPSSYSSARLSRGTNSVIVTFLNLSKVTKVTYTLSYNANGVEQGVVGSVTPNGSTDSRDLYFGTCSHGVCTPHRYITSATLLIETTLKSGGTNVKRYKIKI